MATNTNIKNALTFPAATEGTDHPLGGATARTIGNAALVRFQAALGGTYRFVDNAGASRSADANDAAVWLWEQAATFTKNYEQRLSVQALTAPAELDDT
jgi:hypothetical protein